MVRIHEDVLYEILKSLMRSGIAGISIVSAYIAIVAIKLRIASVFQADLGILSDGNCMSFAFFGTNHLCHRSLYILISKLFAYLKGKFHGKK